MVRVTAASVGDLATLIPSFQRSLRASNKSPKTLATYGQAASQLLAFLCESGMATEVAEIEIHYSEVDCDEDVPGGPSSPARPSQTRDG